MDSLMKKELTESYERMYDAGRVSRQLEIDIITRRSKVFRDTLEVIRSGVLPNGDHVEGAVFEYVCRILERYPEENKNA